MQVDLTEVPTSELVEEIKRRSEASIIVRSFRDEGGEVKTNYYTSGDLVLQVGQAEALRQTLCKRMEECSLDDGD